MKISTHLVKGGDWVNSAEFLLAGKSGVLFVELGGADPVLMSRTNIGNYLSQGGYICSIYDAKFGVVRKVRFLALKLGRQVAIVQGYKIGNLQPSDLYVVDLVEDPGNQECRVGAQMFSEAVGGLVKPSLHSVSGKLSVTVIGGGFNSLHGRLRHACKGKFDLVFEESVQPPVNADQSFAIIEL